MRPTAAVVIVLGVLTAGPLAAQGKQARPDIAGTWKYNTLRSDRPEDKLQALEPFSRGAMMPPQGTQPPGGQPQGERGERGEHGGMRGGRMPYGRFGGTDPSFMMDLRHPPQTLSLVLTDTSVAVEDESGHALHLPINGKKIREETPLGIKIDRSAEWKKDGDLVITEKTNSGTVLRRTCRLDPVTHRLTVLVRFEGDRMAEPIEIRRVYDRVLPAQ